MKIVTHNGAFHADDVFAVALLKDLYPDAEVVRSRSEEDFASGDIVLDVGGVFDPVAKRFDHHQEGRAGIRENGVFYSAMGLIWQAYGLQWCGSDQKLYERMDRSFVTYLDADDNGQNTYTVNPEFNVDPITIDDLVRLYRPAYGEEEDFDGAFMKAVQWAQVVLDQVKRKYVGKLKAAVEFENAYLASPDKRYVVLDTYIPREELDEEQGEILFVVYPDVNGSWRIKTVNKEKGSFEPRKSLPEAWAGLSGEDFVRVVGVEDAQFCHNARFIAGAKSREGVLKLLNLALNS